MEEIKDRLRWARVRARYDEGTAAAEAFGWTVSTYLGHENGDRKPRLDRAKQYAKAFKVRWQWLYHGEGEPVDKGEPPKPPTSVPVISWVSAGRLAPREGVVDTEAARSVDLVLPKGDWVGLEVDGDSMDRIAPPGSLIVVNRADKVLRAERFYVVALESGDATFKRYRPNPERLQPFSSNPDHETIPLDQPYTVFGRVRRVITELK